MGLEASTTISGLNKLWPLGTDGKNEGDGHLRLLKEVLQQCFVDDDPSTRRGIKIGANERFRVEGNQVTLLDVDGKKRLSLSIDAAANIVTITLRDAAETILQRFNVSANALSLSNGIDAGTVLTTGNIGTNAVTASTIFQVGTSIFAAHTASNTVARAQAVTPRIDATTTQLYNLDVTGNPTALAGAWQARGGNAIGGTLIIAQRIS
jgi:hypothetical protein